MFQFPQATEIKIPLAKSKFFKNTALKYGWQTKLDNSFIQMVAVNELSYNSLHLTGRQVPCIFVIRVDLKEKDYDFDIIKMLPSNIKSYAVYALCFADEVQILICSGGKFFRGGWQPKQEAKLVIQGQTLDEVWENFVRQVGKIENDNKGTLAEQIAYKQQKDKLIQEIDRLDKKSKKEPQPRMKFAYHQQMLAKKKELELLNKNWKG